MPTREDWVEAIRSYKGVRFRHMGRNRHGVDCFGMLAAAANDIGIYDPRMDNIVGYKALPSIELLRSEIGNFLAERPYNRLYPLAEQAELGDILVIHVENRQTARHMGVYTGLNDYDFAMMVHADGTGRRRVEEVPIVPSKWAHRIHSVWFIPQIQGV